MENPDIDSETMAHGVLARDREMLSCAIKLAVSDSASDQERVQSALQRLLSRTGKAIRISISGAHCDDRTAFIESLGLRLIETGHRVAVLTFDSDKQHPHVSTPGQRTAMAGLSQREEGFVHHSACAGQSTDVTRGARTSLLLCEAAGYDVILMDIVDDGQSNARAAEMVDCSLALVPSRADDQSPEIHEDLLAAADIIAVIKSAGSNEQIASQLASACQQALAERSPCGSWKPVAMACSANIECDLDELWQHVRQHRRQMIDTGEFVERREQQKLRWLAGKI